MAPCFTANATASSFECTRSLPEDVPHVGLHRLRADEQLLRDVLVAHALREQPEDLPLALGEVAEELQRVALLLALTGDLGEQPGQRLRVDQHLAVGRRLRRRAGPLRRTRPSTGTPRRLPRRPRRADGPRRARSSRPPSSRGDASLILRVASIPVIPPPLNTMSIRTTSGRCSVGQSRSPRSGVCTGGATRSSSSSRPTIVASASVRILWSSQISSETVRATLTLRLPPPAPGSAASYPRSGARRAWRHRRASRAIPRQMNRPRPDPVRSS